MISNTNRIRIDGFHPVDERIGAGLEINVNKYLNLSPSYLFRGSRNYPQDWSYEHRLRFDGTIGYVWEHLSLKNRNRIERKFQIDRPDTTRYRNRTTIRIPIKQNDREIFGVYASYEPNYDLTRRIWSIYDISAGISAKLSDAFGAEFFYLHRGNINDTTRPINAIGANFRIRLGN